MPKNFETGLLFISISKIKIVQSSIRKSHTHTLNTLTHTVREIFQSVTEQSQQHRGRQEDPKSVTEQNLPKFFLSMFLAWGSETFPFP